ncbi:MAG: alanine racemase [Emergencia sp.]|jgi:alanine racemase|nr:alanine racemase [Emergencia sp.]
MENNYYNSYFKVDMDTVVNNYKIVKKHIGPDTDIIPVVKGNCYGFGLVPMAKLFVERCGAKLIANSAMHESVELRHAGLSCEILIVGGIPQHLLHGAVEYDLQIPLFEEVTARRLNALSGEARKKTKVHIKINTGMNRLGVKPGQNLENLLNLVKSFDNIEVVGAYTHFVSSTADYYDPFTLEQFARFQEGVSQIKAADFSLQYVHCCNSAATSWYREAIDYSTHVRSCTSILGHMAMEDGREPLGLTEPVEIGTYITNVHQIDTGDSVGYSRAFIASEPMKIATLSVGFADGFYPAWMRKQGPVLVNGRRTRFLGCCMDQAFIDVTGIPCEIGDKVIMVGRDGDEQITTWEMEQFCENTFEFLYGTLGHRVARIYK